jgi:hypothetical protein
LEAILDTIPLEYKGTLPDWTKFLHSDGFVQKVCTNILAQRWLGRFGGHISPAHLVLFNPKDTWCDGLANNMSPESIPTNFYLLSRESHVTLVPCHLYWTPFIFKYKVCS